MMNPPDKMPSDRIPPDKIEEAIKNSGYLIEGRVEELLRARNCFVQTNSYLPDPITKKPREHDLMAFLVYLPFADTGVLHRIAIGYAIECINNQQPVALFIKEPQDRDDHYDSIKASGLPIQIYVGGEDGQIYLPRFLNIDRFHHYFRGPISTQWATFAKKKGSDEWVAKHDDSNYESFGKIAVSTEYMMGIHHDRDDLRKDGLINLQFVYPVLCVENQLIQVDPSKGDLKGTPIQHGLFSLETHVGTEEKSYLIDVVTESYMPSFISMVEEEIRQTAHLVFKDAKYRKAIMKTIEIATSIKMRTPGTAAHKLWNLGDG